MRGRKALPPQLKIARGTYRKDRAARSNAAPETLPPTIPEPPSFLNKTARQEWGRITRLLQRRGTITALDRALIGVYCMAYATYTAAQEQIAERGIEQAGNPERGFIIASPSGYAVANPAISIASGAYQQMLAIGRELGLTPASRASAKVPAKPAAAAQRQPIGKEAFFSPRPISPGA